MTDLSIVQFQIVPTPWKVNGNSEGVGVSKANIVTCRKYGLNWNFKGGGGFKPKNLPWEGYGYFLEQYIFLISLFKSKDLKQTPLKVRAISTKINFQKSTEGTVTFFLSLGQLES